jgi:nicotinamidase-related amidase
MARPVDGFEPLVREKVFERQTLSAYGHFGFDRFMAEVAPSSVVVAGLSASITFMATAIDAFERQHRMVVLADALAGQSGREAHAGAHEAVSRDVASYLGFVSAFECDMQVTTQLLLTQMGGHK